jgi:hypothetical protein
MHHSLSRLNTRRFISAAILGSKIAGHNELAIILRSPSMKCNHIILTFALVTIIVSCKGKTTNSNDAGSMVQNTNELNAGNSAVAANAQNEKTPCGTYQIICPTSEWRRLGPKIRVLAAYCWNGSESIWKYLPEPAVRECEGRGNEITYLDGNLGCGPKPTHPGSVYTGIGKKSWEGCN